MNIAGDLEYYLERKPTADEIAEAEAWTQDNPGANLWEWINDMVAAGLI